MAVVWVPSLLRGLTQGKDSVIVPGSNLRSVINNMEERYPGFKGKVMDGNRLSPTVSVAIDGAIISMGLLEKVEDSSEISFLPAIGGG